MKYIFLLLFFFAPTFAFSQQLKAMSEKKLLLLYPQKKQINQSVPTTRSFNSFKADLSAKAFFCRLEDQYNRKKALPFKFRLGDVQAVEQMEHRGEEWRMKN